MNYYERYILPHILNLAMKQPDMAKRRERVIPQAEGRVLEIGMGSGLNLPFYSERMSELIAIEPSPKLREMTEKAAGKAGRAVDLRDGSAEA
ncbi:MAG: class I SAM-dependent methyltransferase, partial [Rhodospirillaceae bacterium]